MNQSHIPFGESEIGASIIDGPESIIGHPASKDGPLGRVSKQIPEVTIEEEEPGMNIMPKK